MARRFRRWATIALLTASVALLSASGGVGAQVDVENAIVLTVANCPVGMSVETLAPEECAPVTDGFAIEIVSLTGIMPPLTLDDAERDGDAFVWGDVVIDERGAYGPLAIRETELPSGYTDYVVAGDGVEVNGRGEWTVRILADTPTADVSIYNLAPSDPEPENTPPPAEPGLAAALVEGACTEFDASAALQLAAPETAAGEAEGAADALPVATSYSVVDVSLDTLLETPHAVAITDSAGEGDAIACGAVGGVRSPDGALTIGLRAAEGEGGAGVAYLAPLPDDPERTQISLFVIVPD